MLPKGRLRPYKKPPEAPPKVIRGPQGPAGLPGQGLRGPPGAPGLPGATPDHRWVGDAFQFQKPDGTWGKLMDLRPAGGGGGGETNTASSSGAGESLVLPKVKSDLPFKSLVAGTNITLTPDADTITIAGEAGSGEANTASNSGAGEPLALTKVGTDLPFKTIVAGTNITLTPAADTLTIAGTDTSHPGMGIQFSLDTGENGTFTVDQRAGFAYDISELAYQTDSNTIVVEVQIAGVAVGGLSALTATTSPQVTSATTSNSVSAGDKVTLVLSGDTSATGVSIKINGDHT